MSSAEVLPGISRRKHGKVFRYFLPDGRQLRDARSLARIGKLAIPPAWTDVWICPDPKGSIQATGRDARRRKQYRYHAAWIAKQDERKYGRLAAFVRALPELRKKVRRDLRGRAGSREQVLALLVTLLEATFIRVGNEEYRRSNGSYGLTTLEDRHVSIRGDRIIFDYRGKGGIAGHIEVVDRTLARLVRACRDIPGRHLFQYLDERGIRRRIRSTELNAYVDGLAKENFTAKDFRTWGATLAAATLLERHDRIVIGVPGKRAMLDDIAAVAERLGNTPAICRKSYVHPALLQAYQDENAFATWKRTRRGARVAGLSVSESRLLRYLTSIAGSRRTS
jgi:DNA topoisomerase-1